MRKKSFKSRSKKGSKKGSKRKSLRHKRIRRRSSYKSKKCVCCNKSICDCCKKRNCSCACKNKKECFCCKPKKNDGNLDFFLKEKTPGSRYSSCYVFKGFGV